MKEILNRMKKINKRVYLIIVIILVVLLISLLSYRGIVNRIRENYNKEEIKEFDYRTYSVSGRIGTILFSYDEKLKYSNSKGFFLQTI